MKFRQKLVLTDGFEPVEEDGEDEGDYVKLSDKSEASFAVLSSLHLLPTRRDPEQQTQPQPQQSQPTVAFSKRLPRRRVSYSAEDSEPLHNALSFTG